jgi:hypothetical protein
MHLRTESLTTTNISPVLFIEATSVLGSVTTNTSCLYAILSVADNTMYDRCTCYADRLVFRLI